MDYESLQINRKLLSAKISLYDQLYITRNIIKYLAFYLFKFYSIFRINLILSEITSSQVRKFSQFVIRHVDQKESVDVQ